MATETTQAIVLQGQSKDRNQEFVRLALFNEDGTPFIGGGLGSVGAQGPAGPAGPQGPPGPKGDKGDKGDTGAAGLTIQGPKGDKGDKGDTGWTGGEGAKGDKGDKGDQGIPGPVGPIGQGDPGPQGLTGAKGDKGDKGDKGNTGDPGPAGPTGATGATGAQGPVGPEGDLGPAGPAGAAGAAGPAGSAGPAGATGPAGPKGDKGDTGSAGADGAAGVQGPTGPAGATGATGAQGPKGDTGATGPAGAAGTAGAAGPTGATGATGAAGADGLPRQILNEGSGLTARTKMDFVGASVNVTDDAANDKTIVTIGGANLPVVTALPDSPADGQVVFLQTALMAAQSIVWQFRYNASSPSVYKWEFVGGPPYLATLGEAADPVAGTGGEQTTLATYGDLTTVGPSITVPLSGSYQVALSTTATPGSTAGAVMSPQIGATAASDVNAVVSKNGVGAFRRMLKDFVGGTALVAKYRSTIAATAALFFSRSIEILPIRVSSPSTVDLNYVSNGDTNGVVYYLGATVPGTAFATPVSTADSLTQTGNNLRLIASSRSAAGTLPHLTVDRANSGGFATTNTAGGTLTFDFLARTMLPELLTLRHQSTPANNALINFVLEGSNDNSAWTTLLTVTGGSVPAAGAWRNWPVIGSASYRYLRIRSTGVDSSGANYLVLGEVEFYGKLLNP